MDYSEFASDRARKLAGTDPKPGKVKGVVYYMHRDQRMEDNWAAIYAQNLALKHEVPLHVVGGINVSYPGPPEATRRAVNFSIEGLRYVAEECKALNIQFNFLQPYSVPMYKRILEFMEKTGVNCVVADFSPLRPHRGYMKDLAKEINAMENAVLYQVDAHNIVPCWIASKKEEWRAFEMRNRIFKKFDTFFTEFPEVVCHPFTSDKPADDINWEEIHRSVVVDENVKPIELFRPGSKYGYAQMNAFFSNDLHRYMEKRNDPSVNAISDLSPWLHAGHISAQRVIIEAKHYQKQFPRSVEKFIDETVTWSEMSDNYCYYNENYDNIDGAPDWARETLDKHASDERQWVYTCEQWEKAETHDNLWNAAQLQLVKSGKMHGYMRMYWAKKILEWSATPKEAIEIGVYLNDKFSLDGADSNGFNGVMWSIAGVHDPPKWGERPVFGLIRYQSYKGCVVKFPVQRYISRWLPHIPDNKNLRRDGIEKYFTPLRTKKRHMVEGEANIVDLTPPTTETNIVGDAENVTPEQSDNVGDKRGAATAVASPRRKGNRVQGSWGGSGKN